MSVMYDVPSRKDVGKVVITADVVLKNVNPTLVPRDVRPPHAAGEVRLSPAARLTRQAGLVRSWASADGRRSRAVAR